MALRPLEQALLYTLAYTTQFQYPLTPAELSERLIFALDDRVLLTRVTTTQIVKGIKRLVKLRLLHKEDEYLVLPGFENTVQTRAKRQAITAARQPELTQFVSLVQQCPWVAAVFVTGSFALANGEKDADIDFLVVTYPQRLWLARLWLLFQAMKRGKRRSWQGEEKGSWCFNLWVEQDQLAIFGQQASVYTAYELLQAQVVFDRAQVAQELLAENSWAKKYLPRFHAWDLVSEGGKDQSVHQTTSPWLNWLNRWAYRFQWWYMKPHVTREKVRYGYAFFHPRDTQSWIYHGWAQVLHQITL